MRVYRVLLTLPVSRRKIARRAYGFDGLLRRDLGQLSANHTRQA
jgi:hypothetical protein